MEKQEIAKRIKQQRKHKKISQAQLGAMIGRTESSITKYEAGTVEIPLNIIGKIAEALEESTDFLIHGQREKARFKDIKKYKKSENLMLI